MPELFQGLLAAGIPFAAVVALGIYIQGRWSARKDSAAPKRAAALPRA